MYYVIFFFNHFLVIDGCGISWNCTQINVIGAYWWSVNMGHDDGLKPSGNKPLPKPMLTQICVAMRHSVLNFSQWSNPEANG